MMNKYKIYFQAVAAFMLIAVLGGGVIPWLVSAKSTIAVALGILTIVFTGVFLMWFPGYLLKQFKKGENEN